MCSRGGLPPSAMGVCKPTTCGWQAASRLTTEVSARRMGRLFVFILWLLHFLPLPILAPVGQGLGMLAYVLVKSRRHIARVNLKLCFPEMNDVERERLLRRHFRAFARGIVESGIAWWGSERRLRRTVQVEGEEHVRALRGERFIALVPHFV